MDKQIQALDTCLAELQRLKKGGVLTSKSLTTMFGTVDALSELRLHVKYAVFDMEATRRENAYLRKLLENS